MTTAPALRRLPTQFADREGAPTLATPSCGCCSCCCCCCIATFVSGPILLGSAVAEEAVRQGREPRLPAAVAALALPLSIATAFLLAGFGADTIPGEGIAAVSLSVLVGLVGASLWLARPAVWYVAAGLIASAGFLLIGIALEVGLLLAMVSAAGGAGAVLYLVAAVLVIVSASLLARSRAARREPPDA